MISKRRPPLWRAAKDRKGADEETKHPKNINAAWSAFVQAIEAAEAKKLSQEKATKASDAASTVASEMEFTDMPPEVVDAIEEARNASQT